jgi:hypothetical protein
MMFADMLSLYRSSPFRSATEGLWHSLSPWEWGHVAVIEAIALLFLVLTAVKCNEIQKFEGATEHVLQKFHNLLFPTPAEDGAARTGPVVRDE